MTNDMVDLILSGEDIKPGEMLRWHIRGVDETQHDYRLGTVVARDVGTAMRLAHNYWPDCNAYLNWAERVELNVEADDGSPNQT